VQVHVGTVSVFGNDIFVLILTCGDKQDVEEVENLINSPVIDAIVLLG